MCALVVSNMTNTKWMRMKRCLRRLPGELKHDNSCFYCPTRLNFYFSLPTVPMFIFFRAAVDEVVVPHAPFLRFIVFESK